MNFIAQDNKDKKDKETKEKQANSKRQEKEDIIKRLDADIQQVRSEIDKHKDALYDLKSNQTFLLDLTPQEYKDEREVRVQQKKHDAF